MENFNYPVSKIGCGDKIMQTRRQLDEVMGMMRSNIEKLSERSERLEDLACRADSPTIFGYSRNIAMAAVTTPLAARTRNLQSNFLYLGIRSPTHFQAISLCESDNSDQEALLDTD
ncbi:hypothetical protein OSTOST_06268 [Ostertagia ostertagi]